MENQLKNILEETSNTDLLKDLKFYLKGDYKVIEIYKYKRKGMFTIYLRSPITKSIRMLQQYVRDELPNKSQGPIQTEYNLNTIALHELKLLNKILGEELNDY